MAKRPTTEAAEEAGRNMMRFALVALAMVGVVMFFIVTGRVDMSEPVELTARLSQPATYSATSLTTLDVSLTLANNTDEALPLELRSQCDIFRWFVTDEDKNLVQSQRDDEPCVNLPVTGALEPKTNMTGNYTLNLDPTRVTPGDYILFIRYWGYEIREPLTIN
ncbi:hypothetical protein Plav_2879 [Parvibaculum lavamentivorans DS-1]|uniref:Uncharacterized protein n=1 Tax=Parvibaculum lavamentivorans (strain DS-1 / DSM 13023 / NCIMB 13966) TaxID=402881 RepID=A7HX53_PARL1|nr:hypothetical protein [Parvibaculum lavamentivorans]ABS64486.1 hypothetical protein Plav_2879 [Parvibaculum lavamentivorans DS-1]